MYQLNRGGTVKKDYMTSVKNNKKVCRRCNEELDLSNFKTYKKNDKTYYQSMCIPCRKEYNKLDKTKNTIKKCYEKNGDKYRKQGNEYNTSDRGRELNKKRSRTYRENNSLKAKARNSVRTALRNGSLLRPSKCSECNKECIPEAHHPDYNKPLEIKWLCKSCHEDTHHKK